MKFFTRAFLLVQALRLWVLGPKLYKVKFVEDFPAELRVRLIYVTGTNEKPWQIAFICPCGCEDKIELYADQDTEPHWDLIVTNKDVVTLRPSVWRTKNCRSHFFLTKGRIEWVPDYSRRILSRA